MLLFRVGDFYETFYEDAVEVSRILSIALTTRDKNKKNPVPLAGVPFHAAETYVTRLLAAGKKVAICEQTEDPSKAKGLVKRDVVEVLTPGNGDERAVSPGQGEQLLSRDRPRGVPRRCRAHRREHRRVRRGGDRVRPRPAPHTGQESPRRWSVRRERTRIVCSRFSKSSGIRSCRRGLRRARSPSRRPGRFPRSSGRKPRELRGSLEPLESRAAGLLLAHCHSLRERRRCRRWSLSRNSGGSNSWRSTRRRSEISSSSSRSTARTPARRSFV